MAAAIKEIFLARHPRPLYVLVGALAAAPILFGVLLLLSYSTEEATRGAGAIGLGMLIGGVWGWRDRRGADAGRSRPAS